MNQIGIYNLPRGVSNAGNKALEIFTKLKRRAKETEIAHQSPSTFESGQVTQLRNIEPNVEELGRSAMNSYRLRSEVVKTENGREVMSS